MGARDAFDLSSVGAETACEACPWCGDELELELLEVWNHRDFHIATCCPALYEEVVRFLNEDPKGGAALLRDLGIEALCGERLRRVADDQAGRIVLDWNLRLVTIEQAQAKSFVRDHHEHHRRPPAGWRFGAGVRNGNDLMGVVMVGRPVAKALDHTRVVEANRVCVRRDLPSALRWNCCSMLYGYAAREAKVRGFARIVTYTLQEEEGTTLRAAGWACDGPAGGGSWNRRGRPRVDRGPTCRKMRWSKTFS